MASSAGPRSADFAIALRDEWQSQGLGEVLFDDLIDIVRHKGWNRIRALALADNIKMINLFRKKGCALQLSSEEGVYRVEYSVPEPEEPA